jgi:glyoxylase-like metal-dependent hydrolase (beta-lactamase superfamily II)
MTTTGKGRSRTKKAPQPAATDWRETAAARVRMYRHGLGDCFLLTFPRPRGRDFQVLIDCGVILGTPNGSDVIAEVVESLKTETDHNGTPTVDVLVATHEHWDHLSAFADAQEEFDDFSIGQVWLAWTEDPHDTRAKQLRKDRAAKVHALQLGLAHMRGQLAAAGALGADGASGVAADDFRRVAEVLAFFGVSPDDPPPAEGLGAAGAKLGISDAMDWCRSHAGAHFWKPGDVIEPKEVKGLRVYVLGPPTDPKQLHKSLPTKAGHETYEAALGVGAAAGPVEFEPSAPFDPKYRVSMTAAAGVPFFRTHYFGSGPGDADGWRRIDGTALDGAAEFALQLDSDTNNTSLALAFELPDGRVLLFPADAQVGNWESWHADSAGRKLVFKAGDREVTAAELLARTVLYKVGHHGSHNATLRGQGLEMMTDPRLAALVPVDTYIAHEKKHWKQMPFGPLLDALRHRTKGRVIVADQPIADLPAGTLAADQAADATDTITVAGPGGKQVERPLYVDYFVPAS